MGKSLKCGHVELVWNGEVYESSSRDGERWKLTIAPTFFGFWMWRACYDGQVVRSSYGFESELDALEDMYAADGLLQWFVSGTLK